METLEFNVKVWMGIITGWRKRILVIEENGFKINRIKDHKYYFPKNNSLFFPLKNAMIIDVAPTKKQNKLTPNNENELIIETTEGRSEIRANSKQEKIAILSALNERLKEINSKTAFSPNYENNRLEIAKHSTDNTPWDILVVKFNHFQNLFNEMSQKLDSFQLLLVEDKKPKIEKLIQIHSNLLAIKDEMKLQFDDLIAKAHDFKDLMRNKGITDEKEKNENNKQMIIEGVNVNIDNEIKKEVERKLDNILSNDNDKVKIDESCSSNYVSDDEGDKNISSDKHKKNPMVEITFSVDSVDITNDKDKKNIFSNDEKDFTCDLYNKEKRVKLPKDIKCGTNMVKEFIKSMTAKKGSLPIYFNEPISMLQKQCEKFYYDYLLKKADKEESKEMQLCYISAFIIGEIFLNLGRLLKPFNPILGETYEYYDNERCFRYFSEQVSHLPPITAFYCESMNYVYFGDTRGSTSIKILKGCLEFIFGNKAHIILKKSNNYFTFNKPSLQMKGLLRQQIRYDYSGEITIQNANNSNNKCVLILFDEGKKPLGTFEGKVFNSEGEVTYLIKGNWTNEVYMTDPDGNNKFELLKIEDHPYIHNNTEVYTLPPYTCSLNEINSELSQLLPDCDSRLRPDLREYEEGNTEKAQEMKLKIEEKQEQRHIKFEEEKVKYTPHYFYNVFNDKSRDEVYMFNGEYWNDRKKKVLKSLKESDVFTI